MGTCSSSTSLVRSPYAQPTVFSPGDATSTGSNARQDCVRKLGPSFPIPGHIDMEQTCFSRANSCCDIPDRIPIANSDRWTSTTSDPKALAVPGKWHVNICEDVVYSPETNSIMEDEQYSRDRDNQVITVVSNADNKSLVSAGKVSLEVFEGPPDKSIDERDNSEGHSRPISNMSSLTSASPVPSPMNSLSFTEFDHDDSIVLPPRLEKCPDLRKTRSLFGNSFNSLSSQMSPTHRVLPVGVGVYEGDEMEDYCLDW